MKFVDLFKLISTYASLITNVYVILGSLESGASIV